MTLFTQNSKMKHSSNASVTIVNWTLPALQDSNGFKTCPMAGLCAVGCYARQGTYRFSSSVKAHEEKLELSKRADFYKLIINELESLLKKPSVRHLKIRIHDAGDFYNERYLKQWLKVMTYFDSNPNVSFYAYTKQVEMMKSYKLPKNFTVIYSYGGKQDALINVSRDRHARVFESLEELTLAGYSNGTENDLVAAIGKNHKIGLIYHGTKNYDNTRWNRVKI